MVSRCTIGAIASKNASAFSSVSSRIASANGAEVRGPVATMTLRQSAGRQAFDFAAPQLDQGVVFSALVTAAEKPSRSTAKRAAGRDLVGVGGAHDQRPEPAHFGVQQPDRIVGGIIGAKRIRTDEFGKAVCSVGLRHPVRAHLMQDDANAGISDLPGRFRAGKTAADDVDGFR